MIRISFADYYRPMVRIGLPENVRESLLQSFPRQNIQIVRLPDRLDSDVEVDFWIPPLSPPAVMAMFPRLKGLKVVQCVMAGVDWILPWVPEDIILCDGRGLHDIPVAEWVVAAILANLKRFRRYRDRQDEQFWDGQMSQEEFPVVDIDMETKLADRERGYRVLVEELNQKKVLILGYGSIGAEVERRLQAFEIEVIRIARTAKEGVFSIHDLNGQISQADVVVLLVPLTKETRGLMNADRFARMKFGSLLVNAARGPVVETDALLEALHSRRIHAVLDVTDPEPLPKGHPLWSAPNCFITPHIAGSVAEFNARAYQFVAEQVQRYVVGEPLRNQVDEAGY